MIDYVMLSACRHL